MIIIKDKFCFLHIPKTSGSSFTKIIGKYIHPDKEVKTDYNCWQDDWHSVARQHTALRELKPVHKEAIKGLDVITIVRNPYSRIVSQCFSYNHLKHFHSVNNFVSHINDDRPAGRRYWPQGYYLKNDMDLDIKTFKMEENPHQTICKLYDLDYKEEHVLNRGDNSTVRSLLNKRSIEIINKLYRADFERFGYDMVVEVEDLPL